MNDKVIRLFEKSNLIFLATIMKDGSPQLSPVWGDFEDGYVLVNTAEGRIKHKNVQRDPRVAISVVDKENPLNMTTIRGKVESIIPDYEYQHANKLTKKYMGKDSYPFKQPGEKRIIFKIIPERVFVLPELKMNDEG
ncbi:MAG: PPOX class F420-dependent oxidoreductase [Nitrosopumilaceae archaeon]